MGKQSQIEAVCIGPDDKMDARLADIAGAIAKVNVGQGVIILTDMFGGTPSRLGISVVQGGQVEVGAGLNLPRRVKLARISKDYPLLKCATAAQDAGRKYSHIASQVLQGE